MLVLSKKEVMSLIDMDECISVVESAFKEYGSGHAYMPKETLVPTDDGVTLYTPSYLKRSKALACKIVTIYRNNSENDNASTIVSKIFIHDILTGKIKCVMDGDYITGLRTGAASAVATKYLSRDNGAMTLGIFGSGIQARTQLIAVACVREINKVYVHSKNRKRAIAFISDMSKKYDFEFILAKTAAELTMNADIICTATTSDIPLFDGEFIKPGTHINCIGSYKPNTRELDSSTIKKALFIGDSKETVLKEAGEFLIPLKEGEIDRSHFYADLGEITTGRKRGRLRKNEITVFKSVGLAFQDTAAAQFVFDKAVKLGIGEKVSPLCFQREELLLQNLS
jgi:ornithine cyclodeaminase/alanine dehydrogenase-like protein (mu-crystallin family)